MAETGHKKISGLDGDAIDIVREEIEQRNHGNQYAEPRCFYRNPIPREQIKPNHGKDHHNYCM